MEESAEEVRKREEKMQMFQACKEALNIIGECSVSFSSQLTKNEHYEAPKKPSRDIKRGKSYNFYC